MSTTVAPAPDPVRTVQDVLKCKWAMAILGAIAEGEARPSAIERSLSGLSHKILHQRLAKLVRLGLVERIERGTKMQHVEYLLTPCGAEVARIIADIRRLPLPG